MKICYGCKHFYMTMAETDWSEVTPGCDWGMSCNRGRWRFDTFSDDERKFAACLDSAEQCPEYEERGKR